MRLGDLISTDMGISKGAGVRLLGMSTGVPADRHIPSKNIKAWLPILILLHVSSGLSWQSLFRAVFMIVVTMQTSIHRFKVL